MDKDLPVNHGFYQYVRITAPLGSVTNCVHPAPVVGGWETHVRVNDLIFKALSVSLPDEVPAGTKAMQCHSGFGGEHPRTGEYYCYLETLAGGYGARSQSDGPDAVQAHGQNTENAPVEELESNYPLRIDRYGLIPDSEGAGKYRGGLGIRRDYLFPSEDDFHHTGRPRSGRAARSVRRPARFYFGLRPDERWGGDAPFLEIDRPPSARRRDFLPHVRRRRL